MRPSLRLPAALLTAALLAACGGSDSGTPPKDDPVTSVTVGPAGTTVDIGATVTLTATVRTQSGADVTSSSNISWSSTATDVATVAGSGATAVVTGVDDGTATVRATASGRNGSATVTVVDPNPPVAPSSVTAVPVSDTEVDLGWTDNSDNEDGFRIEIEELTAGAPPDDAPMAAWAVVTTVGENTDSHRVAQLDPGTTYRFLVRACNDNGCTPAEGADDEDDAASENIETHGTLVVETEALPDGLKDEVYEENLEASGGDGTFAWSVSAGALPDGLTLDGSTGTIGGTPTATGAFAFTVEVTSAAQTEEAELSITVNLGGPLALTTTGLAEGRVGIAYDADLEASGGVPPYTWSIVGGALQDGLALEGSEISGTPTASSTVPLTVRVTDGVAAMDEAALDLTICGPVLSLGIGEMAVVDLPDGCGAVLPDGNAGYRVAIMARDDELGAGAVAGGLGIVATAGTPGVTFPVAGSGERFTGRERVPAASRLTTGIDDLAERTARVHHLLREEERARFGGLRIAPDRLGPPRPASVSAAEAQASPPATRDLFVIDPTSPTRERVSVSATLKAASPDVWYYVDDAVIGTVSEPTQAEVDNLLAYYSAYGKPVIDGAFGGLGPPGTTTLFKDDGGQTLTLDTDDLDGNGVLIVFQVRPTLMLGGAAAYVHACDRYPRSPAHTTQTYRYCQDSNQGEITYFSDPFHPSYLGILVHEAKHVSSHGYAVFGGHGYNPSWIEEGTAEIAKEKSSRDASGFADGFEIDLADFWDGSDLRPGTDGIGAVVGRANAFLWASPLSSLFADPDPNPSGSTYYGASWLFHRFLVDNYATGGEDAFLRALNTGGAGVARIETVTGTTFSELLSEFLLAIAVEQATPTAESRASHRFASYDFWDISTVSPKEWPYVLGTAGFTTGLRSIPATHYGAPSFFDFQTTGGTSLRLDGTDSDGEELNALDDVVLVVVRIR